MSSRLSCPNPSTTWARYEAERWCKLRVVYQEKGTQMEILRLLNWKRQLHYKIWWNQPSIVNWNPANVYLLLVFPSSQGCHKKHNHECRLNRFWQLKQPDGEKLYKNETKLPSGSCQTGTSTHSNGGEKNSPKINKDSEQSQIKFAHVLQGALMNPSI